VEAIIYSVYNFGGIILEKSDFVEKEVVFKECSADTGAEWVSKELEYFF
jgi:hypothetical protein